MTRIHILLKVCPGGGDDQARIQCCALARERHGFLQSTPSLWKSDGARIDEGKQVLADVDKGLGNRVLNGGIVRIFNERLPG